MSVAMAATLAAIGKEDQKPHMEILNLMGSFFYDPLGFVRTVYPWGKEGTLLAEYDGPDEWQCDILREIGEACRRCDMGLQQTVQIAIASGHGIGKTALVSWIIHWFVSTRPHPQIVTTANTKTQLTTKTWRELSKWHQMSMHEYWFEWTATKFTNTFYRKTWFATAVPWSEHNSEAFAGTHEKYVLIIFDEASNIADTIWEVTEGALTTVGAIWICFGNPTRNTGRFRDCFKKFRHRWVRRQIDSRTAKMANSIILNQWIEDWGLESDFVRVRVLGQFPEQSDMQFISQALVDMAKSRKLNYNDYRLAPIVVGVDVARFGDDKTCITVRQGLKVLEQKSFGGLDGPQVIGKIMQIEDEYGADAVFIDVGAMGAGVIDGGRQLGRKWTEVNFGGKATQRVYYNKRSEMWGDMRDWLKIGSIRDVDPALAQDLEDDLIGPEYWFDKKNNRIILESKKDMKDRKLPSPDHGDSLALTFAQKVKPGSANTDEDKFIASLGARQRRYYNNREGEGPDEIGYRLLPLTTRRVVLPMAA